MIQVLTDGVDLTKKLASARSIEGRFTSTDPIFLSRNKRYNPQDLNLYVYCGNNPLINIDPDGNYYLGTNGHRVKVTMVNGQVKVGKNASSDLKRMADLVNKTGSEGAIADFLKVGNNATKVHFKIETNPGGQLLGLHQAHDKNGKALEWDRDTGRFKGTPAYIKDRNGDLVYKEATITIYEGNIKDTSQMEYARNVYGDQQLTSDERMVAVNAHEDVHDTDQEGIDKIRERQQGRSNNFDPEAASEQEEKRVQEEIKRNRKKSP